MVKKIRQLYYGPVWQSVVGCWLLAGLIGLFDWVEVLAVSIGFLSWLFKPAVCNNV